MSGTDNDHELELGGRGRAVHGAGFIAGGTLAAWAVVLAVVGSSRPEFAARSGPRCVVIAVNALLVAVTWRWQRHALTHARGPARDDDVVG